MKRSSKSNATHSSAQQPSKRSAADQAALRRSRQIASAKINKALIKALKNPRPTTV